MKKFKNKCIIAAATLALGLSLTACGGNKDVAADTATTEATEAENANDSAKEDTAADDKDDATEADSSETAKDDAATSDEGTTMYTTESITLHAEASASSEDLGIVPVGSTLIAYETYGDYIKVEFDEKDGYVLKEYVTDDKEASDKALEESLKADSSSDSNKSDNKSSGTKKNDKKSTECLDNGLLN